MDLKLLSKCSECGESKALLTEVGGTLEVVYMCNDCYKLKYSDDERKKNWKGLCNTYVFKKLVMEILTRIRINHIWDYIGCLVHGSYTGR